MFMSSSCVASAQQDPSCKSIEIGSAGVYSFFSSDIEGLSYSDRIEKKIDYIELKIPDSTPESIKRIVINESTGMIKNTTCRISRWKENTTLCYKHIYDHNLNIGVYFEKNSDYSVNYYEIETKKVSLYFENRIETCAAVLH